LAYQAESQEIGPPSQAHVGSSRGLGGIQGEPPFRRGLSFPFNPQPGQVPVDDLRGVEPVGDRSSESPRRQIDCSTWVDTGCRPNIGADQVVWRIATNTHLPVVRQRLDRSRLGWQWCLTRFFPIRSGKGNGVSRTWKRWMRSPVAALRCPSERVVGARARSKISSAAIYCCCPFSTRPAIGFQAPK
jgi:hypothetical protein